MNKKSETRQRNRQVQVRMTESEYQHIARCARAGGMTIASLLRSLGMELETHEQWRKRHYDAGTMPHQLWRQAEREVLGVGVCTQAAKTKKIEERYRELMKAAGHIIQRTGTPEEDFGTQEEDL